MVVDENSSKGQLEIAPWMQALVAKCLEQFPEQLVFVGLQGSYRRCEAKATSDIDAVVILRELGMEELKAYRQVLSSLSHFDLSCGFVSGVEELKHWEASELFQFYYDTQPYYGSLDFIKPYISRESIARAVKLGAGNIYHAAVHNYVHAQALELLPALYKAAFFVLQAKCYLETGRYCGSREQLKSALSGQDLELLVSPSCTDLSQATDLLLSWSSRLLRQDSIA